MKKGNSRVVFLTKNYAIKLPRFKSDGIFLTGLLGNVCERDRYKVSGKDKRLGQVIYCAPFGLFLIMRRYYFFLDRTLTQEEKTSLPFINIDDTVGNIAIDNGNVVVIDYGNSDMHFIRD